MTQMTKRTFKKVMRCPQRLQK